MKGKHLQYEIEMRQPMYIQSAERSIRLDRKLKLIKNPMRPVS